MGDIHIRPFAVSDLAALARLVTALGYPTTVEQMTARMARIAVHPDHATFLAEVDGVVVGMVGAYTSLSYEHDAPTGRVTGVVVDERARGRGIGASLMARAEAFVRERGARQLALTSHLRREEAHAFYRHLGYEETGRRFVKRFED